MSDKPMSTANELNAESARALAAIVRDVRLTLSHMVDSVTMSKNMVMTRDELLVIVAYKQQQLIDHAFARIEALEAAAREREGDGK